MAASTYSPEPAISGFSLVQLAAVRRCGQNISLPLYASQNASAQAEALPQASSSPASITPRLASASHDHEQPRAPIDSHDKEPDSYLFRQLQRSAAAFAPAATNWCAATCGRPPANFGPYAIFDSATLAQACRISRSFRPHFHSFTPLNVA